MSETEKKKRYEWSCHVVLAFDANKKDEKNVQFSKLNFGLSLTDVLVGPSNVHNGRHFNISWSEIALNFDVSSSNKKLLSRVMSQ